MEHVESARDCPPSSAACQSSASGDRRAPHNARPSARIPTGRLLAAGATRFPTQLLRAGKPARRAKSWMSLVTTGLFRMLVTPLCQNRPHSLGRIRELLPGKVSLVSTPAERMKTPAWQHVRLVKECVVLHLAVVPPGLHRGSDVRSPPDDAALPTRADLQHRRDVSGGSDGTLAMLLGDWVHSGPL